MGKASRGKHRRTATPEEHAELKRRLEAKWPWFQKDAGKSSEIGRELKADELVVGHVVIIQVEDLPWHLTLWVESITDEMVVFHSAELNWSIGTFRKPDGTLEDDKGRRIHVYKWKNPEVQ